MTTITISVGLTVGANPEVDLDLNGKSARIVTASNGDTIKFQREGGASFTVTGFDPLGAGTAFNNEDTGGNGQWLSVDVAAANQDPPVGHEYTLTVTADGKSHNTTETDSTPDNGRPVIRN